MSLWNQIEPICKNIAYGESFPALIETKSYGYFSQKVQGVSGYYDPKFLAIVLYLLKEKIPGCKKVFQAIVIRLDSTPFTVIPSIFKRSTHFENMAVFVLVSFFHHAELEKEFPDTVAKPPVVLGRRDKTINGEKCIRIDTIEEKYPTTLSRNYVLKEKISLNDAIQGLYKIALALDGLHKKNVVHCDIKNWNVFVQNSNLLLFDFDLARSFPSIRPPNVKFYEFWDTTTNRYGLITPFCDVFGWTVMLGTVIWGKKFHEQLRVYIHTNHFPSVLKSFYQQNLDKFPHKEFYKAAYTFILSMYVKDIETRNKVERCFKSLTSPIPHVWAMDLYKQIEATLPKMQDCIQFIHPWVLHPTQAK